MGNGKTYELHLTISEELRTMLEELCVEDGDTVEIIANELLMEGTYGEEIQFLWRELSNIVNQMDEEQDRGIVDAMGRYAEIEMALASTDTLSLEELHTLLLQALNLLESYMEKRCIEREKVFTSFVDEVYKTHEELVENFKKEMEAYVALEELEDQNEGGCVCGGNCSCH